MKKKKSLISEVERDKLKIESKEFFHDCIIKYKTFQGFFKKIKPKLEEIEEKDIELRYLLDLYIRSQIRSLKPNWFVQFEPFPNPTPDRKYPLQKIIYDKVNSNSKFEFKKEDFDELFLEEEIKNELIKSNYQKSKEEIVKLKEDRIRLYEEIISKNKRIITLSKDRIEKKRLEKENYKIYSDYVKLYRGFCKYFDIYELANEYRRNGKTLDYGLNQGINKYRNSNVHLKNLLSNYKSIEDAIEYLHNAYYKTKYKDYKNFK